ncbi:MAG: hypothetical protein DMD42_07720 [Gemmatimonadetes bacterium]|nr:MAG: hypothetical protein DMD42_07720 [Gemmatimonadota bacterium]
MDNLAHTLVGAALGRAVAGRELPAAGWVGAIAGNAPDWAELLLQPAAWTARAGGEYLVYHRGITHSFVGAGVEIVALTGLFGLLMRLWARRAGSTPPSWRWVAACVTVSVASHLYLDWQGSYGLRPFLPWSGRWYYADWVAIVDPFFWAVPLVALAWGARPRSRRVVGTGGHGRMHRRRCDRLDAALVRGGGPAPRRSVRAPPAGRLRRYERRGERGGQGGRAGRRDTAVRTGRPLGSAHHRRASLPLGGPLRFDGQCRGRRLGGRATARASRRARRAGDPPGSRDRAVRPVSRGGGRFERRRRGRIAVGCALPCAWVGSARLGRRAGQAALTRLDWAAQ